jgi:hypothetical protein
MRSALTTAKKKSSSFIAIEERVLLNCSFHFVNNDCGRPN